MSPTCGVGMLCRQDKQHEHTPCVIGFQAQLSCLQPGQIPHLRRRVAASHTDDRQHPVSSQQVIPADEINGRVAVIVDGRMCRRRGAFFNLHAR